MFEKKFSCKSKFVPDQPGNYRETIRENDKALDQLGWTPEHDLENYINSL